jgi:glycosyltransferase involved in cell wall biosynthesis
MLSDEKMENYRLTLPNKIIDYMACGKPFIGSRLPQVEKIVTDEGCGVLVDSSDTIQISNAILDLLNNNKMAKKMGANGIKAVAGG